MHRCNLPLAKLELLTASGRWLDLIGGDFFGITMLRFNGENDARYRSRIQYRLFRQAATRQAVALAVEHLTGSQPLIFEPANPVDTGAYSNGAATEPGAAMDLVL